MSLISRICLFIFLVFPTFAMGQSTVQQDLGIVTAPQIASGLGWNLGDAEVEFQAAAAAGATHARLTACGWAAVEGQSAPPNNVSTGYSLPPQCVSALTLAKKYGLQPTVVAAYGAPYHQILTVTVSSTAAAGATSVPVAYASGVGGKTLASIVYPYAYVDLGSGVHLSMKHGYAGTLVTGLTITGDTTATLTLSSALENAVRAGTTLYVNEILYPSPITDSPTDTSVIAFANYAQYLAKQVNAYGLTGEVELWNEPPWFDECWDDRRTCYDVDPQIPGELPPGIPNFGFAAVLQLTAPVPGVPYIWSGANKTASDGMLAPNMLKFSGTTFIQPQASVTIESMHPYGNNPEDGTWLQPCLVANPKLGQHCNTIPGSNANFSNEESETLAARQTNPSYGINHTITETGISTTSADLAHIARFAMRQYLGYMADGVEYIEFFRMYEAPNAGQTLFSFITPTNNGTDFTPLPNYTAMAGLMSDIAPMKLAPVAAYSASSMPQVTSYSGTYNLDYLSIVGARSGDTANSILFTLWQRSDWQTVAGLATECLAPLVTTPCWGTMPQPADASTTVSIPTGMKVAQVVNLDTRVPVSYSQSGSSIILGVSDDPIEILLIPSTDNAPTAITPTLLFASVPSQIQGSSVTVHASSVSSGAVTYSILSGPATISGATVTVTDPGTVVVKASQAASGNYTAATTTTNFSVTAVTPVLTMTAIPSRTYGDPVNVQARSISPAPITFSIVSGPATISGTAVTLTGIGTVVVSASQPKSGYYTAASTTISFTVAPKQPVLVFAAIPPQTYGTPLTLSATSASSGAVTYSVISGPATISGSTVSYTSNGQVTLQATQAASGGYSAATATASFHVGVETPTLKFQPIPTTAYNTTITVSASSQSTAPITYYIVSGPAKIVGSTVTTKSTSGTVVVEAVQAALGGYSSATTTISFQVAPTVTPSLAFAAVSSHFAGDSFGVSASSASNGPITYSIVSGPATLSGSTVSTNGSGPVVVQATQAASGTYSAATATATIVVAPIPALTFAPIAPQTSGNVFNLSATSPSPGAVTYFVLSGPAIILSGSTCEVTGAGTVVIQANQAASGIYHSMGAQTSFTAIGGRPTSLTFLWIHAKAYGDVFPVSATSASSGDITYSVVSGPATISGSTVTITGTSGTVTLQASQAASGSHPATTTTVTFPIIQVSPTLSFAAVAPPAVGSSFTAAVISNSTGKLYYKVVSGPAKNSGPLFTVTGAGTIVIRADQDAAGRYGPGHVIASVQVQ